MGERSELHKPQTPTKTSWLKYGMSVNMQQNLTWT